LFLPWGAANAEAWKAGNGRTELEMDGRRYYQKTFKYPAGGLSCLRQMFEAVVADPRLRSFLDETGCLAHLGSPSV
jgi:hypothetical protein